RLLTLGRRRAPKGDCFIDLEDLKTHSQGLIVIALPPAMVDRAFVTRLLDLRQQWQGRLYLGGHHHLCGDDDARLSQLAALAARASTPLVALNDVHFHVRSRKPLQDVLTCIRHGCTIDTVGTRLFPNAERCLKTPHEMALLFANHPDALARTVEIAGRCGFSLDELAYEYPDELTQAGRTPAEELRHLAYEGAHRRYGETVPETVVHNIEHELALIGELSYEAYFLTVYDIVRFARSRGILCQGRGSAANSTVCFCLGITAVDPARMDLLFERFISAARDEPPDIDVDFEHERREEVIQYIYSKYGRDRAGLAATVICYRTRGAVRDVGKALGLSEDAIAAISSNISGWNESRAGPRPKSAANPGDGGKDSGDSKSRNGKGRSDRQTLAHERLGEIGLDVASPRLAMALDLIEQIRGFPRHLSQHVGGFVLTRGPLSDYVPIENAAMQDRTVIEWDKDDLEALGLMKVDVLALGMLSCMRRCFELLEQHYGERHSLASIPAEDPAVYEMLSRGDSLGVFQVESRAQMNMLPRLRPRTFYDLVVEVAIVRPGPIQGDMVHPYLRRRRGEERVSFPSDALGAVLGKTLGV
ncbi:MAG: error-prone DNA polymerase, partial [Alphaproteobacteria bacterium]